MIEHAPRRNSELPFVPALIALATVLPVNGNLWILIATIAAGLVLLFQSVGQERQSMDILANAAYLGYISVPMVQSVTEYLSELSDQPEGTGQWIGAIVRALGERGYFEEQDVMLYEVAELNDFDLSILRGYLADYDPDVGDTLERILSRKNASTQESGVNAEPYGDEADLPGPPNA
jgi:hypothetical protein